MRGKDHEIENQQPSEYGVSCVAELRGHLGPQVEEMVQTPWAQEPHDLQIDVD